MDYTLVDIKSLKTHEDLAVHLATALYSLMTLNNFQIGSLESGLLNEEMIEKANTIVWDIRRLMKHYTIQLESVLDILPDDFDVKKVIKKITNDKKKKNKKELI